MFNYIKSGLRFVFLEPYALMRESKKTGLRRSKLNSENYVFASHMAPIIRNLTIFTLANIGSRVINGEFIPSNDYINVWLNSSILEMFVTAVAAYLPEGYSDREEREEDERLKLKREALNLELKGNIIELDETQYVSSESELNLALTALPGNVRKLLSPLEELVEE